MAVLHYPICLFIKFSVTARLTAELPGHALSSLVDPHCGIYEPNEVVLHSVDRYAPQTIDSPISLDDDLLSELLHTALEPEHHPELYRAYGTQEQARRVEQAVIANIISTYKAIKFNQRQPNVQSLNARL